MLKYLIRIIKEVKDKVTTESVAQFRIVNSPYVDEILMEIVNCYSLEKKVGLNWYSVPKRTFATHKECLEYYNSIKEYMNKTKVTYQYLNTPTI